MKDEDIYGEKKKVRISIKTVQLLDGEEEITVKKVKGTFAGWEDIYKIEYSEGGEIGGTTAVDRAGPMVHIKRNHSLFDMEFYLEAGFTSENVYFTPYGELNVKTVTEYVESDMTENGGTLEFRYILYYDDKNSTDITLLITVSEDKDV